MSSLDRAFFRAYAKEQPAATPAEPATTHVPEGASPYVHFQSPRKPQLRYRLEPTHAPWGTVAPHVDAAPLAIAYDVEDYCLAAGDEVPPPAAWAHAGEAHLAPPVDTQSTPLPVASLPVVKARQTAGMDPFAEGIVCLPGMTVPESNYLATLVTAEPVDDVSLDLPTPFSVQAYESKLAHAEEPPPEVPVCPTAVEKVADSRMADPAATEVAAETTAAPSPEVAGNRTSLLSDEAPAFWEVDRYLYPAVSDRLLSRYEYFTHAGEKLKQASAAGLKVLGITGVGREEGRSTLAICLARAAARSGLKVVVIDCDFQRPQLAQQVGLDVTSGWQSVAMGQVALAEVAIRSLDDGILLLPLTDEEQTHSLSLDDERVARVIQQSRQSHDVVILDVGPHDAEGSANVAAAPLDAAIVVWDRRRRKLEEAQAVAQSLSAAGVEAVGIAENFAS